MTIFVIVKSACDHVVVVGVVLHARKMSTR